jgi:hypothetical protein
MIALLCAALVFGATVPVASQTPTQRPRASLWPLEPDGYRGVKFGTPMEKFDRFYADDPDDKTQVLGDECNTQNFCTRVDKIGDVPLAEIWTFSAEKRLGGVVSRFKRNAKTDPYDFIKAVLIKRYGPPTATTTRPVQNRLGATFKNERVMWVGKTVILQLDRYSKSLDEGFFVIAVAKELKNMAPANQLVDAAAAGLK